MSLFDRQVEVMGARLEAAVIGDEASQQRLLDALRALRREIAIRKVAPQLEAMRAQRCAEQTATEDR